MTDVAEKYVTVTDQLEDNPSLVFEDPKLLDAALEELRALAKEPVDLSTKKGRAEIASRARIPVSLKTTLDAAGKQRNDALRVSINAVDEIRRRVRTELDAVRDEIRRPLDQWEEQEKARVSWCERSMLMMREWERVGADDTSETVASRLKLVRDMKINEAEYVEFYEAAVAIKANAITNLEAAHARLVEAEAQRVELERLRREAAEREAADRARAEEQRKAKEEADRQLRIEAEKAAAAARAAAEAEARTKAEAEIKARREREELERQHQEQLAAAERARREAEAEAERQRAAEKARLAQAAREEAEAQARIRDHEHRNAVTAEAQAALMKHAAISSAAATRVMMAITAGHVPNVKVEF